MSQTSVVESPVADDVAMPERTDERRRARRLAGPLASAAGSLAALGYLAAVNPNEPGHYPLCPTQALFSVDCPGCGIMRGTHDLITGDVPRALDHNVLLVALVPLAVVLWARWLVRAWRGVTPAVSTSQFRRRNLVMISALIAILVFGVIRNFLPYLGSGIG